MGGAGKACDWRARRGCVCWLGLSGTVDELGRGSVDRVEPAPTPQSNRKRWPVSDPATVTPEHRLERPAASEVRERSLLDAALDCVISMDDRGRVTYFNASAQQTF